MGRGYSTPLVAGCASMPIRRTSDLQSDLYQARCVPRRRVAAGCPRRSAAAGYPLPRCRCTTLSSQRRTRASSIPRRTPLTTLASRSCAQARLYAPLGLAARRARLRLLHLSGRRVWRLWAARRSQGETGPLGAWPRLKCSSEPPAKSPILLPLTI